MGKTSICYSLYLYQKQTKSPMGDEGDVAIPSPWQARKLRVFLLFCLQNLFDRGLEIEFAVLWV